jgi:glutamyl-tRNA synthetase
VKDIWSQAWFFFEAPATYDETVIKKRWTPEMPLILSDLSSLINSAEALVIPANAGTAIPPRTAFVIPAKAGTPSPGPEAYEGLIKGHIAANSLNMGAVMNCLRLCLVGSSMGPGVFDIMALLGPDEVVARIERAISVIG